MVASNDAWNRIFGHDGQIFSVAFRRKNDKTEWRTKADGSREKVIIEPAGSLRRMLCRRRVAKYTRGIIPPGVRMQEDIKHDILTVWDIGVFNSLRRTGLSKMEAGRRSYRRINMSEIVEISLPTVNSTHP